MPEPDQDDAGRLDELMPDVYEELRAIAAHHMRRERTDHTLQTTALVHEVYLRLGGPGSTRWRSRAAFFAAAAAAVRRILIEHARRHGARKRGGAFERITLDDTVGATDSSAVDLLAIDGALEALARFDARMARVVELRFFGGLTVDEVAETLGLSKRTIESDWTLARAWLRRELGRDGTP